jgi:hypothetical protein
MLCREVVDLALFTSKEFLLLLVSGYVCQLLVAMEICKQEQDLRVKKIDLDGIIMKS